MLLPPVGRSDRPACYQPEVRRCCRSDHESDNHADSDDHFEHNNARNDQFDHNGDNEKHDDHVCGISFLSARSQEMPQVL